MSAMANITLTKWDASNITYYVLNGSGPAYSWADTAQGTPGGYRTISLQVKQPVDPSKGVTRTIVKIARPHVNDTTGVVDYIGRASIEVLCPVNATLAERRELWATISSFVANGDLQTAVVDGVGKY